MQFFFLHFTATDPNLDYDFFFSQLVLYSLPVFFSFLDNISCNGHGRFLPNFGHLSIFYPFDVIVWRYILDYTKKILSMLLGFTLQWHVLNIGSVGLF